MRVRKGSWPKAAPFSPCRLSRRSSGFSLLFYLFATCPVHLSTRLAGWRPSLAGRPRRRLAATVAAAAKAAVAIALSKADSAAAAVAAKEGIVAIEWVSVLVDVDRAKGVGALKAGGPETSKGKAGNQEEESP